MKSTFIRWGPGLETAAHVATAIGVLIAAATLVIDWNNKRVDRAVDLIGKVDAVHKTQEGGKEYGDFMAQFPDRYPSGPLLKQLPRKEAEDFWEISAVRANLPDSPATKRYELARRHLNQLSEIAFAYVHKTSDRDLLAGAFCNPIVKSEFYFRELIGIFGQKLGKNQSWQVITAAAKDMKERYPTLCKINPDETLPK